LRILEPLLKIRGGYKMKNPTGNYQQGSQKTTQKSYSTSLTAQRERLLKHLRNAPLSTIEARHKLDVLSPAARIFELRHNHGYNIHTHWQIQRTPEGNRHRVALYVLRVGKYDGSAKL